MNRQSTKQHELNDACRNILSKQTPWPPIAKQQEDLWLLPELLILRAKYFTTDHYITKLILKWWYRSSVIINVPHNNTSLQRTQVTFADQCKANAYKTIAIFLQHINYTVALIQVQILNTLKYIIYQFIMKTITFLIAALLIVFKSHQENA